MVEILLKKFRDESGLNFAYNLSLFGFCNARIFQIRRLSARRSLSFQQTLIDMNPGFGTNTVIIRCALTEQYLKIGANRWCE